MIVSDEKEQKKEQSDRLLVALLYFFSGTTSRSRCRVRADAFRALAADGWLVGQKGWIYLGAVETPIAKTCVFCPPPARRVPFAGQARNRHNRMGSSRNGQSATLSSGKALTEKTFPDAAQRLSVCIFFFF